MEADEESRQYRVPAKRRKLIVEDDPQTRSYDSYHVAWICALHIEMAAACAMLDEVHAGLPRQGSDSNSYTLGSIGHHNVIIACLPTTQYGTNNAAIVLTHLTRTFQRVRVGLMVGIGGGVPSKRDIRLGDIVVGTRVMQDDLGKMVYGGQIKRTATPRLPSLTLTKAVSALRSKHELGPSQVPSILQQKLAKFPEFTCPNVPDNLYHALYDHASVGSDCDNCNSSEIIPRSTRMSPDPVIHYGGIASGNQVMRNGTMRDLIARELDVVCFEMEAAGLMDIIPCLPIRGICDYSDSHKNKVWQKYAAAVAAAYAAELLALLPGTGSHENLSESFILGTPLSLHAKGEIYKDEPDRIKLRRQAFLNGLRFKKIDSRKVTIEKAHVKTCAWFLEHPTYQAWLDPYKMASHHGFLWIKGKPGVGKSTIMKFAYLKQKKKADHESPMHLTTSFFFNARGEYLERSVLGMYRSILLQVLEAYPDLQTVLDNLDLDPEAEDVYQNSITLKEIFSDAILAIHSKGARAHSERSLTLFIDALDECDEQQTIDMVQYLEELAEECLDRNIPFRVCFSSRHYPYITVRHGLELILEVQPGHTKDLQNYIESRLRVQDLILAKDLQTRLLHKSGGIFLWVILVVNILNKEDANGRLQLEQKLDGIPSDLNTLFKSLLLRDGERKESLVLGILWILYSARPLSPAEYYHALWIGLSLKGLADPGIPSCRASDSDAVHQRFVISSTKGFAESTKGGNPTVQFIHESVRDFLLKDQGLQQLWPDLGFDWQMMGQDRLKECCQAYLTQNAVSKMIKAHGDGLWPTAERQQFAFLEYASRYIFHHAEAIANIIPQDHFISQFPLHHWVEVSSQVEDSEWRRYKSRTNLLYVLAKKAYPALIRIRRRQDSNINIRGGLYSYPFFAALALGGKSCVAALFGLESSSLESVDITEGLKNEWNFRHYSDKTPLTWAAERGNLRLVELLIQNGSPVCEVDKEGVSPLGRAMRASSPSIIKLLIEKGADIGQMGIPCGTLLAWASDKGHLDLVKYLLRRGVAISDAYKLDHTAICAALDRPQDTIIECLVDEGAAHYVCRCHFLQLFSWGVQKGRLDLVKTLHVRRSMLSQRDREGQALLFEALENRKQEDILALFDRKDEILLSLADQDWTLLGLAAARGHTRAIKLLINMGADINLTSGKLTPLMSALRHGRIQASHLLIEEGANVNAPDELGGCPLIDALRLCENIAVLLISKGASVNFKTRDGATPLTRAIELRLFRATAALLERGADANLPGSEGHTALTRASRERDLEIVNLLIEYGADVNICDSEGHTPLTRASREDDLEIVNTLVDHGADVDVCDGEGRTPLMWASLHNHWRVVDALLRSGARFQFTKSLSPDL